MAGQRRIVGNLLTRSKYIIGLQKETLAGESVRKWGENLFIGLTALGEQSY